MIDGATFAGWILATLAIAGLWGAFRNETWLSVLLRTADPSRHAVKIV